VNEKHAAQPFGQRPDGGQQFLGVGVGRKTCQHLDLGLHLVCLAENPYLLDPLGQSASERVLRLVADDQDGVGGLLDVVLQVVENPTDFAHPAGGDDDHRPLAAVQAFAFLDVLRVLAVFA